LEPVVISVKAEVALLYNQGFKNPSPGFPAATRPLFRSCMMLAKVGVAQLVPSTPSASPLATMVKSVAWAATSGYARPELLKYFETPEWVLSFVNQEVTAES
jgi:hypothetical protein